MRSLTLARMTSLLVCGLVDEGSEVTLVSVAVFMLGSPCFCFHAVGMYLHAERHLAKAGVARCKRRGIAHPCSGGEAGAERAAGGRSAQANRGPGGCSLPAGVVKRGRLGRPL